MAVNPRNAGDLVYGSAYVPQPAADALFLLHPTRALSSIRLPSAATFEEHLRRADERGESLYVAGLAAGDTEQAKAYLEKVRRRSQQGGRIAWSLVGAGLSRWPNLAAETAQKLAGMDAVEFVIGVTTRGGRLGGIEPGADPTIEAAARAIGAEVDLETRIEAALRSGEQMRLTELTQTWMWRILAENDPHEVVEATPRSLWPHLAAVAATTPQAGVLETTHIHADPLQLELARTQMGLPSIQAMAANPFLGPKGSAMVGADLPEGWRDTTAALSQLVGFRRGGTAVETDEDIVAALQTILAHQPKPIGQGIWEAIAPAAIAAGLVGGGSGHVTLGRWALGEGGTVHELPKPHTGSISEEWAEAAELMGDMPTPRDAAAVSSEMERFWDLVDRTRSPKAAAELVY